jgi:hypothetical protein
MDLQSMMSEYNGIITSLSQRAAILAGEKGALQNQVAQLEAKVAELTAAKAAKTK